MDIEEIYRLFMESAGVTTDTRKNLDRKLFFALKGENFDGNLYALKAIEGGANYAIVDEVFENGYEKLIVVVDVLSTLQQLAFFHRKVIGLPILAITGSNGKTTNKELVASILSCKFQLYFTKGNLNNHIGVPLSLLEMTSQHNFAVIEMGANKLGDIEELCQIADPDYGYITNIGTAHLEGFKSRENIAKGKGELLDHIKSKDGLFFFNGNEGKVKEIVGNYANVCEISEANDSGLEFVVHTLNPRVKFDLRFDGEIRTVESHLYGRHNYENLKMAVGIGLYFGISPVEISSALSDYKPSNNRSQIVRSQSTTLYMDAYNANPSSMLASINSFQEVQAQRQILILGDMLELGAESSEFHQEVIDLISEGKWQMVILIGEHFQGTNHKNISNVHSFLRTDDASSLINIDALENAHVLVKGSRGHKLESLEAIQHLLASQEPEN